MNIKEIIDAERWAGGYDSNYNHVDGHTAEVFYSDHNTSIARLEKAVMKYIAELELRLGCCRDASTGKDLLIVELEKYIAGLEKHIAELEAQLPKVVKPQMMRHVSGPYWLCNCATVLDGIARFDYCPYCGSKLNWEEA